MRLGWYVWACTGVKSPKTTLSRSVPSGYSHQQSFK